MDITMYPDYQYLLIAANGMWKQIQFLAGFDYASHILKTHPPLMLEKCVFIFIPANIHEYDYTIKSIAKATLLIVSIRFHQRLCHQVREELHAHAELIVLGYVGKLAVTVLAGGGYHAGSGGAQLVGLDL